MSARPAYWYDLVDEVRGVYLPPLGEKVAAERAPTAVQVERPRAAPPTYEIDPPLAIREDGIVYEQQVITVRHIPVGQQGGREYWETAAISLSTPGWVVAFLPGRLGADEFLRRMGYTVAEPRGAAENG